jgi:CheY-like chemotaxis protein
VPSGQFNVFIVEDNEDDREQMCRSLKQSPHIRNIYPFENGDRFMSYVASETAHLNSVTDALPAIVFLDLHMPGTNGMEILKELREHPVMRRMPVIITTSDLSDRQMLKAYELQANAYVLKPVDIHNVHELIYNGWGGAKSGG